MWIPLPGTGLASFSRRIATNLVILKIIEADILASKLYQDVRKPDDGLLQRDKPLGKHVNVAPNGEHK